MVWKNKLEPKSYLRDLLDSLPVQSFIDLSKLSSFNIKHFASLFMLKPTLSNVGLSFKQVGDLPFAQLELVLCGGIVVGYLLTSQKYTYTIGRNYAIITRSKHEEDVSRIFVDNNFIILGNDSCLVATARPIYWIRHD